MYKVPGTNVEYDDEFYRSFVRDVRDAVKQVEQMPKECRDEIRRILRTVIRGTYLATRQLYDPLVDQEKMDTIESKGNDYLTDLDDLERKCHGGFFVD
ncbi:hypothetical protein HYV89_01175 [Candidatus Woesearchaeota archaeon]|nr:hypothetical protein [Candidatus Woesearchaeota archaeon]